MGRFGITPQVLVAGLAIATLLAFGGCAVFVFEEPESWSEAKGYVVRLGETTYADVAPITTALQTTEQRMQSASELLLENDTDALNCEAFAAAWGEMGESLRDSLQEQDRLMDEYAGFASMSAFLPATVIYGGMRDKFEMVRHIVGDELGDRLDEVEDALSIYATRILEVESADGDGIAELAWDTTRLDAKAGELALLLGEHQETLGNLLSEEEREAIGSLLELLAQSATFQDARLDLQEATANWMETLDHLGVNPAACEESEFHRVAQGLPAAEVATRFVTATEAFHTRHQAALAAIQKADQPSVSAEPIPAS